MRINEEFAKIRKSEIISYKPKIIIASEGSCSEPKYFDGLNQSVLTENKNIINLLKDYAYRTNSHPNFIVDMYREFLINNNGMISVKEIKNKISNYNRDNGNNIDVNKIYSLIDKLYKEEYIIPFDNIENFLLLILKEEIFKDFIINFVDYFNAQNITYSPETDSINIVIDRDKDSFFDYQYDNVLNFCNENNVNLFVSNPNFEFWLMLHFDEVNKLDKNKMYENKKVSSKRRYLEQQLHLICKYKKDRYDFKIFESRINTAIKNERNYCEDIYELKNNLGSNVGKLVEIIINDDINKNA